MYYGGEHLVYNGKELPYTMLDFWRVALSEIRLNMNRGTFAEFLVRCALMHFGYDALHQIKTGMEPWDIDGPTITARDGSKRRCRIEVKNTASVQLNTPDSQEPVSYPDTRLTFSIQKALDWDHPELGKNRNNDLYVFVHYTAQYKADNILDMRFWDFYVYPTFNIDENPSLDKQTTLSIWRLKQLGVERVSFNGLSQKLFDTFAEITAHNEGLSTGKVGM